MTMKESVAIAVLVGCLSTGAHAVGWNETVDGDLSNDRLAPTHISLGLGLNPLKGGFGQPDLDYLAVVVPAGMQLSALRHGADMAIGGVRSFIGVQAGDQMTVPPDTGSSDGLLGWAHFQDAPVGTDLLPAIGQGFGAAGFVGPLPMGTYTFWIQDTSSEAGLAFAFDVEVTAVPEPATVGLWLVGIAAGSMRILRRGAIT